MANVMLTYCVTLRALEIRSVRFAAHPGSLSREDKVAV